MLIAEDMHIQSETLSSGAYVCPDLFEREKCAVFQRGWVAVAFEHQLPEPGDALPVDIAGVPVLLWRASDGSVKAYLNVCRHRGAKLIAKPTKLGERVTCSYHAWTYDQKGSLCAAPYAQGKRSGLFARAAACDLDLKPVAVGSWLDTIFVDLSGKAETLHAHIRPLEVLWSNLDVARLRRFHTESGSIAGNWKLAIEAAVDTYHEGFVHASLQHRLVTEGVRPFDDLTGGLLFGLAWSADSGLRSDSPLVPLKAGVTESVRRDSLCFLYPNAQFNLFGGLSVRTIWTPVSVNETHWQSSWYLVDDWATATEYAQPREAILEVWRQIREEDRRVIENVHAGRSCHLELGTNFAPFWEQTGQRFQQLWASSIGEEWHA